MNFRRCNNAFYYYLIMEKIYKINKQLVLLPNVTPLVSRFLGEMSSKRQF
jgi:hypothetical protein